MSHPGPKQWSIGAPGPDFGFSPEFSGPVGAAKGGPRGGLGAAKGPPCLARGVKNGRNFFLETGSAKKSPVRFFAPKKNHCWVANGSHKPGTLRLANALTGYGPYRIGSNHIVQKRRNGNPLRFQNNIPNNLKKLRCISPLSLVFPVLLVSQAFACSSTYVSK